MSIISSSSKSYPVVSFKDASPEYREWFIVETTKLLGECIKNCKAFDVDNSWLAVDHENKNRLNLIDVFPHILKRLNVTTQWSYSYNGICFFTPILSAAMLDIPGSL